MIQPNDAGAAGAPRYRRRSFATVPNCVLDGARLPCDTGAIDAPTTRRCWPGGAFQYGPVMIEGEVLRVRRSTAASRRPPCRADPKFEGWYVQGSWILTGEARPVQPDRGRRFDAPKLELQLQPRSRHLGRLRSGRALLDGRTSTYREGTLVRRLVPRRGPRRRAEGHHHGRGQLVPEPLDAPDARLPARGHRPPGRPACRSARTTTPSPRAVRSTSSASPPETSQAAAVRRGGLFLCGQRTVTGSTRRAARRPRVQPLAASRSTAAPKAVQAATAPRSRPSFRASWRSTTSTRRDRLAIRATARGGVDHLGDFVDAAAPSSAATSGSFRPRHGLEPSAPAGRPASEARYRECYRCRRP